MKQASSSSRSGLLLMEIIIAILFFSLASAICLQLFVKAHNLGQDTQELDMAVRQASSVADVLSQSERPLELLRELYPDADIDAVPCSPTFTMISPSDPAAMKLPTTGWTFLRRPMMHRLLFIQSPYTTMKPAMKFMVWRLCPTNLLPREHRSLKRPEKIYPMYSWNARFCEMIVCQMCTNL